MPIPCIGVDPGKNGGFAFIDPEGVAGAMPMPLISYLDKGKEKKVVDYALLEAYLSDLRLSGVQHAYVEEMVKYAGNNQSGSSSAVYGYNSGYVRGILEAQKWQIHPVIPVQWQRFFTPKNMSSFSRNKSQWKNHLKEIASKYFTYLRITLNISDALLIAQYGFTEINKR